MLPFRAKSIRATTRAELDAALASPSAHSVIVEGDDDLLTYAARKASGDPDLRIGGVAVGPVGADTWPGGSASRYDPFDEWTSANRDPGDVGPDPAPSAPAPLPAPDASASAPAAARRGSPSWMLLAGLALAACLALGLFGAWLLGRAPEALTTAPPVPPVPPAPPAPPEPSASTAAAQLPDMAGLAWPVVAIVAIVALYLVARQAISAGSNLEVHWKVTEKVTGRLVISKVRTSAPRKTAA